MPALPKCGGIFGVATTESAPLRSGHRRPSGVQRLRIARFLVSPCRAIVPALSSSRVLLRAPACRALRQFRPRRVRCRLSHRPTCCRRPDLAAGLREQSARRRFIHRRSAARCPVLSLGSRRTCSRDAPRPVPAIGPRGDPAVPSRRGRSPASSSVAAHRWRHVRRWSIARCGHAAPAPTSVSVALTAVATPAPAPSSACRAARISIPASIRLSRKGRLALRVRQAWWVRSQHVVSSGTATYGGSRRVVAASPLQVNSRSPGSAAAPLQESSSGAMPSICAWSRRHKHGGFPSGVRGALPGQGEQI